MTAMFPITGVHYTDAENSLPDPDTINCKELWYSTSRCQPRFDPAAANAVLAELVNTINKGEVSYNCAYLDQLQLAVRYLIQRGLTTGTQLQAGPFDYICYTDPPLTRYNDFLTLVVLPGQSNQGNTRINVDNHGLVQLLRNDGQQLESQDLKVGIPALISYWQGNWYHVGLVQSQVPILIRGGVDLWIRTDGSDVTGDGSANSPDKAFRTIQGAWLKAGGRYAATPLFTMNFRLGIPGTYDGANLGPFGGNVTLTGDESNRSAYRISSVEIGNTRHASFSCQGLSTISFYGLTLLCDIAPNQMQCFYIGNSQVNIQSVDFETTVANPNAAWVIIGGGSFATRNGDFYFRGNNLTMGAAFYAKEGSNLFIGGNNNGSLPVPRFFFNDMQLGGGAFYIASRLAVIQQAGPSNGIIMPVNIVGPQYSVDTNSILTGGGVAFPGSSAGAVYSGGQVVP
jgi:hypothetical protein